MRTSAAHLTLLALAYATNASSSAIAQGDRIASEAKLLLQQRTVSSSGQFIIFGGPASLRIALSRRAEDLAKTWSRATGLSIPPKWPLIIELLPPSSRPLTKPNLSLFIGDGDSVKIQISVPESLRRPSDLDFEVLSALTLEAAYRGASPIVGRPYNQPPPWVAEAILQIVADGEEGLPPHIFTKLVEAGPPPKLENFIRKRPASMDATSRAIYRVQAFTLLRALSKTPEGTAGIAGYITRLRYAQPDDIRPLLDAFPSLAGDRSMLIKIWTLAMADASAPRRLQILSLAETEKNLSSLLDGISFQPPGGGQLLKGPSALPEMARFKEHRFTLARLAESLFELEPRAHPMLQPVVSEFRAIISELARKPRKEAPRRLAAASDLRQALSKKLTAMSDYVNWFEMTQSPAAEESLMSDPTTQHSATPRSDPISLALDAAQRRLEN